jgi:hypothetical protein
MSRLKRAIPVRLEEDGFAVVPNVLTHEQVDAVIVRIRSALSNQTAAAHSDYAMRHLMRSVPEVKTLARRSPCLSAC